VLITHGESRPSGVGRTRNVIAPTSLAGQFEQPYGPMGPPTLFTIPVLRYMKTYGLSHEQLAMVSVVQREWAAKNPRATFRAPITVDDVLNSRMIAYPFRGGTALSSRHVIIQDRFLAPHPPRRE
jgi:acetyl-CoA acetyltransferase